MQKVALFEKVSWMQFQKDYVDTFGDNKTIDMETLKDIYECIKIPKRATAGSAGYDFKTPIDFTLAPGETIKIPTGIRVKIDDGWVLKIYPRSSLGFKYKMRTSNVIPIIDSDYCYSDNEGHIFLKISNEGERILCVNVEIKLFRVFLYRMELHTTTVLIKSAMEELGVQVNNKTKYGKYYIKYK